MELYKMSDFKKESFIFMKLTVEKNIPTLWGLGVPCVHTQVEKWSNAVMQIR